MANPLNNLIVDEDTFDMDVLASVLEGNVNIMSNSGEVRLTAAANKLTKKDQILLYLLGRKAALSLGKIDEEAVASRAVAEAIGMKPNSVSGQLTFLKSDGFVESVDGKYSVPGYAVVRARAEFAAEGED